MGDPLAFVTFAAAAAWLVLVGVLSWRRRPHAPPVWPATSTLGLEPPAVANLVASDFVPTTAAVGGTLLDLAARGIVEVERTEPGRHAVVLRWTGDRAGPLLPYERMLLDHLERVSRKGVIPDRALTTGDRRTAARWWRRFAEAVIADASARGLCRAKWDHPTRDALTAGAALIGALLVIVLRGFDLQRLDDGPWHLPAVLATGAVLAVVFRITRSLAQRDTPRGLEAATIWRSVRLHFSGNDMLPSAPAGHVVTLERHLAYAAALGVADAALAGLPLGAEDDREAWTAHGGAWRRVRVAYPRLRPGWGMHPWAAFLIGLAGMGGTVAFVAVLRALGALVADSSVGTLSYAAAPLWLLLLPGLGFLALWIAAVADLLVAPRDVKGEVLRVRPHREGKRFVAVDDGHSSRVRALVVDPGRSSRIAQHALVRVVWTPWLGHVRAIDAIGPPHGLSSAEMRT